MVKLLVLLLYQIGFILSFPWNNDQFITETEDLELENIEYSNGFPDSFSIDLKQFGKNGTRVFEIIDDYLIPPVSYLKNGKVERVAFESNSDHQTYSEKFGNGFATLFRKNGKIKTVFVNLFKLIFL